MLSYLIRRVLATIPVIGMVAFFVFSLLYLTPGDPAAVIAGDIATSEDIERIRQKLGLDEPFWTRFGTWAWAVLHGDLGISIFTNLPVTRLIAQRVEPTLSLAICTLIVSIVVAVPLGVIGAWKAGKFVDRLVMLFSVLGFSIPVFVLAYLLIYLFAIELDWLPVQGYTPFSEGFWPWLSHLILPSIALGTIYIALIARITRATMLDVLAQDYVRTAHAKGLAPNAVLMQHALKNAAVPIVTIIGIGIALLISGVVVTETVFAMPGIGRLTVDAIIRRDYPDHPGRHPAVLGDLRGGQSARGPVLPAVRSADPILMAVTADSMPKPAAVSRSPTWTRMKDALRRHPTAIIGGIVLLLLIGMAIFAPFLGTIDPQAISPVRRLRKPSEAYWFGTDMLGRDIYSRVVYGARVSLTVGLSVAVFATLLGLAIGLVTGFVRWLDGFVMRIMDGLMSIPGILLAIALMALTKASLENVILAITVTEVPRVVRLIRSLVLTLREQPYVEAAIASGTRTPRILVRHILPNTIAPLLVQATYICASAMLTEAILSFLGAGTPPNIPSWGNIMAEGRSLFQIANYLIFFPGVFLSLAVLSVNMLGDGLRDALDPRLARNM